MIVFDRFKKILTKVSLPEVPAYKPLNIPVESKRKSFLLQAESGDAYLIDGNGNIRLLTEINSDRPITSFTDRKTKLTYLVTTKKDGIYLYLLEY